MDDSNNFQYGYESAVPGEPAPEAPGEPAPLSTQEQPYAYDTQNYAPPPTYQPPPYYPPVQQPLPPQLYQPPVQPKKKKRTGLAIFALFSALAVVAGILVGIGVYRALYRDPNSIGTTDNSRLELVQTPTETKSPAPDGMLTSMGVYDKLRNSNVAVQLYSGSGEGSATGGGSGIILHEDSTNTYTYVLTCAHVINKNERVSVELADGTSYDAAIVGYDSRTDVGVLRIKAKGLQGAEFGDSDQLQVGETIYAIGNPGGVEFKGSFTNGIVSAIERSLEGRHTMQTIQHTAPINPGNSGGALVNSYGQVIGMNSAKIMDMQYEGMGFAIPSKVIQNVVNNLIAKGYVPDRPKLGIKYIAAAETQRGMFVMRINDLPSGSLIIAEIDEDSNISGTEIRANDIITHVNGEPLNKAAVLLSVIDQGKVGQELELTIARVNAANFSVESFDVKVKLVEDKGPAAPAQEEKPWYEDDGESYEGYGFPFP